MTNKIQILVVDGEIQCWWEGNNFHIIDTDFHEHIFENYHLKSLEFKGLESTENETFVGNNKVWDS